MFELIRLFIIILLWIHLFSAILFVGGSFFVWLVVVPASRVITNDESERTQIVGKIAKAFGKVTKPTLAVLLLSGLCNATWYLPSMGMLFAYPGVILLTKAMLVGVLLALIYVHNVHFGKKIIELANEKKFDELKELRKRSRVVSAANLSFMVVILILAVMLQIPP